MIPPRKFWNNIIYLPLWSAGLPEGAVGGIDETIGLALVARDGEVFDDLIPVHDHRASSHRLLAVAVVTATHTHV